VEKDHPRVEAYGEVDELNAALGVARSAGVAPEMDAILAGLQEQLFTVGASLATPPQSKAERAVPSVRDDWVDQMEQLMDTYDSKLPPLRQFILPGGTAAASALHLARTICRRAERRVVRLHREGQVNRDVLIYLNRLSDLLFVLARATNHAAGVNDVLWNPPTD
jgi:cob(I)alamin adenosyltransferase